jgi:hypothetical protein
VARSDLGSSAARRLTAKGILADANIQGQVEYLVQRMQSDAWAEFWQALSVVRYRLEDVELAASASDLQLWDLRWACAAAHATRIVPAEILHGLEARATWGIDSTHKTLPRQRSHAKSPLSHGLRRL